MSIEWLFLTKEMLLWGDFVKLWNKPRGHLGFNVNTLVIEKKSLRAWVSNVANSSESEK